MTPVISINLLNFNIFEKVENFHTLFLLQEKDLNLILTDHLSIHYIELLKLHAVHSTLEKFLYWIKYEGKGNKMLETLIKEDEVLSKAHKQYEKFSSDDEMRDLYLRREMYVRDKLSAIEYAEKKGIEKGIENAAVKLLSEGISVELISNVTGMSADSIEKLKKHGASAELN